VPRYLSPVKRFLPVTCPLVKAYTTLNQYRKQNFKIGGVKIEAPRGVGCGEGVSPSPEKFCIFCIKITRLWCTLTPFWSNFTTGWKMNNNEQQCTKWFILQCYSQPNIAPGSRSRRILPCSNRTTRPKWLVLRKLCELIVLRVVRERL